MTDLLSLQNFHLVGIKGVAMASLAQLLLDAGKRVTGTDVEADFVTKTILDRLDISIGSDFEVSFPMETQAVVYTAAHGGPKNPMVLRAKSEGLKVVSQAEALAEFFNHKDGIAVCGVGGKSTTSAMISYIFEKVSAQSFSVGVGDIVGLGKTGQWLEQSQYMVAEADEYVIDPSAPSRNEEIVPRFSFLKPKMTVCTNLGFDHPDVYRDFSHTKKVYQKFFEQIKPGGSLIINADNQDLKELSSTVGTAVYSFGEAESATLRLIDFASSKGKTVSKLVLHGKSYELVLQVPGKFNVMNAMAAVLATNLAGVSVEASIEALLEFASTKRRFEVIGQKNQVMYFDDYAHHPDEIKAVIGALNEWYPHEQKIVAFQSHTFSRTKELFGEFVDAFDAASKVVMIDIFPSAREQFDPTITSDLLCEAINQKSGFEKATNLHTVANLAEYFKKLPGNSVVLTVGAGDIYEVHDLVQ